jgi:flagellar biogenesis protein FliO
MLGRALLLVLLFASCLPAVAQATRPGAVGESEIALPPRKNTLTTQPASAPVAAQRGNADVVDVKRLGIAMAIVLGAIFVSQKVWKRMGMPGAGGRAAGALQVVSRLSVSPKQQLLLVRVGRRLVLVGNSGTQMNSLCEIADPEEAAGLLGQQAVAAREEMTTSSFNAVLGGEERRFEEESRPVAHPEDGADEESAALATTRAELNGLMEKVRGMSKQFRRG